EDVRRILEHSAAGDDVAGWHGDGIVDVAVLEVELALPEVGIGIPAADVVVHDHARIPLSDFVQRAVPAHTVRPVFGNGERILHADRAGAPTGHERCVEIDAHHRIVDLAHGAAAIDLEAGNVVSALKAPDAPS